LGIDYPSLVSYVLCYLSSLYRYNHWFVLPAAVALATKDSYWYAAGVIAIFGFIQFIEGNFITPKITGSKVSLNSFASTSYHFIFDGNSNDLSTYNSIIESTDNTENLNLLDLF
jgi:hypothetical protein